ncbi:helix-turn-helix domain-containing protein [Bifidobacterium bifidum]|uniref:helix-turn-helix domain-containing protein n=1 Tax=Bifidobacterium bifidum TaxID=1681 RepID=UPI0036F1C933
MRRARGQPGPRRVDDGDRDAGVHGGGASRSKAYDLIWPGEIDSYRLGRKLLVSRASVDAYIESRGGRR